MRVCTHTQVKDLEYLSPVQSSDCTYTASSIPLFHPRLASHPYFSSCAWAEERARMRTRKNTDGLRDYFHPSLPTASLPLSAIPLDLFIDEALIR